VKIFLDTIGCRLNQAEIESLALQFRTAGHEIVPSAADADLSVINTCTVTARAASDSRAAIRRTKRLSTGSVVVTGCWATLEPEKAIALPGVTCVVPNMQKNRLAAVVLGSPQDPFNLEHLARQPLPGLHQRTRAFIKAQDGCDNACTFCITTVARGASRSRPVEDVLLDVQGALNGGTKEIVLTGVQLSAWGHDLKTRLCLSDLVCELLAQSSIPRLRMSSLEPWDLEMDFLHLWSDPHLCRHLHLPLQSGSASVLKRMARRTTPDDFAGLVASARSIIPEVAITTGLITGFPGETDTEFAETMEFVRAMGFTGGHVFPYSVRPGTPAARMKGQVRNELVKERGATLRSILAKSAKDYHRKFIGRTMSVLWEARSTLTDSGWQIEGLTDNFIRVVAFASEPKWNRIDQVLLKTEGPEYLIGEILK
jgi:MiaB-like tRNA modifying enzyme